MGNLIDPFASFGDVEDENSNTGGLADPFAMYFDDEPGSEPAAQNTEGDPDVGFGEELWSSWGRGSNQLLSGIGTLYGMASGDMDNWAREQGERGVKYYTQDKSEDLVAAEAERAAAIKAADSELGKAGAAVWNTVKDPRLLANFIVEQAPMMVPGGAVGRAAAVGARALGAGTKLVRGAATAAGVGSGAALQTGDVTGQAYDDIMKMPDELWNQNADYLSLVDEGVGEDEAKEQLALSYTREVAPLVAAASLATQALPGGRSIEKALAGSAVQKAGSSMGGRVLTSALGEAGQESLEEVSGQMLGNVAKSNVNPEQSVWEGTGEAGGLGALGGFVMGAPAGLAGEVDTTVAPGAKVNYTDAEGNPREATVLDTIGGGTRYRILNDDGTQQEIGVDLVSVRSDTGSDIDNLLNGEAPARPQIIDPVPAGPDPVAEQARTQARELNDEIDSIVGGTSDVVETAPLEEIPGDVGAASEQIIPLANIEADAAAEAALNESTTAAQAVADTAAAVERTATAVSEITGVDTQTASEIVNQVMEKEGEGVVRSKLEDDTDVDADPVYVSRIVDTVESRMNEGTDYEPAAVKQMVSNWQRNETLAPREVDETAINDFLDGKIEAGEKVTRQEIVDYIEDTSPRAEPGRQKPVAEKVETIPTRPSTVREASKKRNMREGGSVRQRVELAVAELGDGATLEAVTKATPGADPVLLEKEYTRAVKRRAKKAESGQAELFDIGEVSPQADNMTGEVSPEGDITLDLAEGIEEGFEVKHRRDGSVLVSGDVTAIRSRLPGNIKGRLNKAKTGLLFSHNQAPRVVSAMRKGGVESAGGATYGRAGRVLKQKPMKNGKYVGAPTTGNTRGKIAGWRKRLKALAVEGEYGRHWYRDSAQAVMEFAGGRLEDAKVLIALMSIYSPQAKVDANTTFALRAWAQYKAGMPVRVKTGTQDEKAAMAIAGDPAFWNEFWSGEKTGNFYKNLMKGIDPEVSTEQGATIDLWMIRAGEYTPGEAPNEQPNSGQYAFMEDETARIAEELGWSPEEVQAAIWVAMKARMENPGVKAETERTSEAKGWIRFDRVDGKKVRVILDADKHSANWVKHAKDHVPDEVDKDQAGFHYGHGVIRHLGQVSWEPKISSKLPYMQGVQTATYEQQLAYYDAMKEALFPGGKDELARKLGLLVAHDYSATPGVWDEEVSPSGQIPTVMAPDKAGVIYTNFETGERLNEAGWEAAGKPAEFVKHPGIDQGQFKLLEIYSAVLGLILQQDGVGFHRVFPTTSMSSANAVEFKLERPLSPNETIVFEAEIRKALVEGMRGANVKAIEKAELARAKQANKERTDAATTEEEAKAARRTTKLANAAARAKAAADAATLNDSPYTRKEMAKAAKDAAIVTTATGVRVMNYGAISDNKLFQKIVESVFETAVDPQAEVLYGYADGSLVENNWETSTNGQDYIQTIDDRGRSDILDYANSVLRPRVEQVNKEFSELFGWGEPGVGVDVTAQEGTGGTSYGTPQEGSVSVQGIHFSRDSRTELDSTKYGTGIKGAERTRLSSTSADPAIQNRTYFYVDEGSGVRPEGGVGAKAHHVQLENLYDGGKDPQGLYAQAKQAWPNNQNEQANELDRLIVEAGFDGLYVPAAFGQQGAAVLIGEHKVPVAQGMPSQARPTVSERSPKEAMADRLAQSKLPGGRMRGSAWAARIKGTEFDSEQAQEALAARSQDVLRRADLADILTEETTEAALDLPTIEVEEISIEEAYPDAEEISYEEATQALDEIAAPEPVTKVVVRHNQVEKQALVDRFMGKLGGPKATVIKLRPGQAMMVRAMERLLGKEVIVFEGGIVDGLASGRETNVLFVNRAAEQPLLVVLGHEFLHQIRNTNPALYLKVVEAMIRVHGQQRIKTIAEEQQEFRNKAMVARGIKLKPLNMAVAVEEVVADLVGASFSDPAFWQALAKETGDSFATKLATKWQHFLQATIDFVNAYTPRAIRQGWMQDVQGNNDVVLELLREYRETMPTEVRDGEMAEATQEELTDNEEIALDLAEDTSMPAPKKTIKVYKMFRAKAGKLYPLFIDANLATPIGEWVKAVVGDNEKSKIGKLALRPGWHAGDSPVARHIGGRDKGAKAPTFRKPDQVWAEVEVPADVDWQSEAESRASRNKKTGAIIPRTAEIKGEVPAGGHYRYKTNPNMEGEWIIGGGLKVNRVLTDQEVADINRAAGVEDLPRKEPLDLAALGFADDISLDVGDGRDFRDFFSKVVTGAAGVSDTGVAYKPVIQGRNDLRKFATEYAKHRGNFDDHIAYSIPGFKEVQMAVGNAVAKSYGPKAKMLDVGASEGSIGKTITSLGGPTTVSMDPNPDMARSFATHSTVPGATYEMSAFTYADQAGEKLWMEGDTPILGYDPKGERFDVVHEAMVFQFINNERAKQIPRVKEFLADDGVAIFEEKLHNEQWKQNEAKKDANKAQYFQPKDMNEKAKEVLEGMNRNMAQQSELESILSDNFAHVVQFWDSGNFKGYMASDNRAALDRLVKNTGDLSSDFSTVQTPRDVTDDITLDIKSEAFKNWFGDSKIVDKTGEPLVMYHGTTDDITAFDKDKIRADDYDSPVNGFWFSSESTTTPAMRDATNVMPVYLAIENPAPAKVWRSIRSKVWKDSTQREGARSYSDEARYRLQDQGYDGYLFEVPVKVDREVFERDGEITITDDSGRTRTLKKEQRPEVVLKEITGHYNEIEVLIDGKVVGSTAMDSTGVLQILAANKDVISRLDESVLSAVVAVTNGDVKQDKAGNVTLRKVEKSYTNMEPTKTGEMVDVVAMYTESVGHVIDYESIEDFESFHDTTVAVAFEPNQIKSAVGNRGTFDPNQDDITLDVPDVPGATQGWEPPVALSLWDRFRILLQNKYLSLLMVQDAITKSGATIRQQADARNMQKRYPGVIKSKLVEFEEIYLKPVQDFMRRTAHSAGDIGKYLMARHIILDGVNARLAALNPDRQNNEALSGMTDEEAQAILDRYGNDPDMGRIGRLVDRMNREKVQLLLDEGILSQTEADRWTRAYQYYMPLNREDLGHTFAGGVGGGGFQQKGKLSKVRGGSHKALDFENALGSVFGQYEASLIRIEKNRVAGALYQLASDHPAQDFWEVDNFPVEKKIVDGVITYVPNTQDAGMIPFKVDGETKWVWMKTENPVAASLARHWKNEDVGMGDGAKVFMKPLMAFMRYQSMINTSLSPEFVISNFMRDLQTAGITMQDTEIKGHTMRVMKSVLPSIKGIGEALFSNKPVAEMGEYALLYKEMEKAGGTMGWIAHYEDVNDRTRAITKAVKRGRTAEIGMAVLDFIGDVNQAVENGVRLASYKATKELLMDQGMTEADAIAKAAVVSRELTVDFQEKGSAGSLVNAGWLFFNASMQGTFRLARAAIKSNKARLGLGAIMLLSYTAHLTAMLGDDDDDEYKMISDSDRERNLIIPSPIGDGYIKIPLGWGLNVFGVLGQEAAEATLFAMGELPEYSLPKSGVRLTEAMLNAFNPVNDGSLTLTLSPTIFDPFVKVTTNTDWHGGNLFPDYVEARADYLKFFRSSSEVSQKATETLARWTRTADGTSVIDVSPETVDMVYDTLTGSMGKFYADTFGTAADVVTGDSADREIRKLPMVRKLWKKVEDSDKQRYAFNVYNEFSESYQAWRDNKDNQEWMRDIGTPKMRNAWNRYKRLNSSKRKINKRISKAVELGQEDREKELRKEKVDMMVQWVEDHHEIMYRED